MYGLLCEMRWFRGDKLGKEICAGGQIAAVWPVADWEMFPTPENAAVCTEWHYLDDHPVQVSSNASSWEAFPRFLLFAAKNTIPVLFCQVITSASSYPLSLWFVSLTKESIIYKARRDFWSSKFHRNQEYTKIQPGDQERQKHKPSTWAFTYKIS